MTFSFDKAIQSLDINSIDWDNSSGGSGEYPCDIAGSREHSGLVVSFNWLTNAKNLWIEFELYSVFCPCKNIYQCDCLEYGFFCDLSERPTIRRKFTRKKVEAHVQMKLFL